jgi:hypothetical protein
MSKVILIISLLVSVHVFGAGGGESGGGDDAIVADFISYARPALEDAHAVNPEPKFGTTSIKIQNLLDLLNTASIRSTNLELLIGGRVVDAENWPAEKKIMINRPRWAQLTALEKRRLSLHEIVSLSGLNDSNYFISDSIAAVFQSSIKCHWQIHPSDKQSPPGMSVAMEGVKSGNSILFTGAYKELKVEASIIFLDPLPLINFAAFEGKEKYNNNYSTVAGWTGRAWTFYPSRIYPGYTVDIACLDCSKHSCKASGGY